MFKYFKTPAERQYHDIDTLMKSINSRVSTYSVTSNDLSGVDPYEILKNQKPEQIKPFVLKLLDYVCQAGLKAHKAKEYSEAQRSCHRKISIAFAVIGGLLRRNQQYSEQEWMELFQKLNEIYQVITEKKAHLRFIDFPFNYAIQQIEKRLKKAIATQQLLEFVKQMIGWDLFRKDSKTYWGSDMGKATAKLNNILQASGAVAVFELKTEDIGAEVNEIVKTVIENQSDFYQILHLAASASGGKPTKKFTDAIEKAIPLMGRDVYRKVAQQFIQIALEQEVEEHKITYSHAGRSHFYTQYMYLCDPSKQFMKGVVWTLASFSDRETIRLLGKLLEKSFAKMPGVGPAAAALGNACAYTLGNMRGKDGLGELARLKLRVKQNNIKKTIDKYLQTGAEKYNVSVEELKEMAVPDFGLVAGSKTVVFGDYQLKVEIVGAKVVQQWFRPDRNSMKSVPAAVKNSTSLTDKLKKIRKEVKEIQKTFSAQKQRIDNQFILDRTWDYNSFAKYYLQHGLVSVIAQKLIWTFSKNDQQVSAILADNQWMTEAGEVVTWIDNDTKIKLWHPVFSTEESIVAWRNKMLELEWKQPIKQAFRELYLLTEAELNTRNYSNRMAAHILKQHQFKTLAVMRDWKYALMGCYDDGIYNQITEKHLPEHGITAEYWIDELNDIDATNDSGIWLYVATDQVKFKDAKGEVLNLVDVPPIVFSEIMRDVDLFVGVCSVGNDAAWQDGNGVRQNHRDYWVSYSFGDLTEIAKTRKTILERLLPRLKKIRDKAHIDGKFLIVKGELRTYKIHIGSGNILMEPNDQYLCIVPARTAEKTTDKLFIPFEGDRGLS
ncbi:MAG: DUF4132 domain-containing protein, partial [Saprospiraceae bacterium]